MKMLKFFVLLIIVAASFTACEKKTGVGEKPDINMEEVKKMESDYNKFADDIEKTIGELNREYATAEWNAYISGKDEDFATAAKCEMEMNSYLARNDLFAQLKEFKETGLIKDEILARKLDLLYNHFLGKQIDTTHLNAMTELSSEIGQLFQTFRAVVGRKDVLDNDIEGILKKSTDSKELKEAWLAHKKIGPLVANDIIKLVKMRNEAAKKLGFSNYHEMSLMLEDQNPDDIAKLFDELDLLTKDAFKSLKSEIDEVLAKKYEISPEELKPWHMQNRYFQEAPSIYELDLDKYYEGQDLVAMTEKYYASIGMDIKDILSMSDLLSKEGKSQHAFCFDIDRMKGDIRILCNVVDNSRWMETMLHEIGHAVYFKYHGKELSWVIKTPAQIFTTEAIAMLFGRFASSPRWMEDMIGLSEDDKNKIGVTAHKILRLQQLVFSRWSQVMFRFEKSMYENPDQDLNKLWWDLVEKYQLVKKPADRNEPDWATKVHIATAPCYYHNYHLGELLASQLYYKITKDILKVPEGTDHSFYGNKEVGKYLIDNIFAPGAKYYWDDMIEKATGEKLTAKYYAKQFVN